MRSAVKTLMARTWDIDAAGIPEDAALNRFKLWDSLGHVNLLLALETEFGIAVDFGAIQTLQTLDAVVEAVEMHGGNGHR